MPSFMFSQGKRRFEIRLMKTCRTALPGRSFEKAQQTEPRQSDAAIPFEVYPRLPLAGPG